MKATIVRYKVKEERAEENKEFIRNVFEELRERRPEGLHYASFNLDDGLTFIHVAVIDTEDGSNPLPELPAFKEFVGEIKDRCVEPPTAEPAEVVGHYAMGI